LLRGKYRLVERLGEGAHGVSYLAEHVYLSHPCVVKILPQRVGDATDAAVRRLRNEARAGFRVHDPNVVRVLDCDVAHGLWYFVMEYVDGVNLGEIVAGGYRLSWEQAVQVASEAAGGLNAIHQAGVLHRDVKPGNLILGVDGHIRVADLGVAGLAHERSDWGGMVGAGTTGTLAYTAPEMFRTDATVGPQADLYSLGVTLYQLITGRLPHAAAQVFQQLIDLQCRPAAWPDDLADDTPKWLTDLILRVLAIEPQERSESAAAFIACLEAPAARRPTAPPAARTDELSPRGIGVLPFHNERANADDDWLGYAVANYLSRALAETPGVYIADHDGLVAMVGRLTAAGESSERARLLEAARMVGAGTVVVGRFSREGGVLRIEANALKGGGHQPQLIGHAEGGLADLPALERSLFEQVADHLGLGAKAGRRQPAVTLEAREKFVLAKQAYLRGEYDQAISLGEAAISAAPEFAEAIGFVGVCLARLGRYEAAEDHHRRQESLAQGWGNLRYHVESLANLGAMNYFRGNYEAAESHYRQAGRVADDLGLAAESAQICNNLGFVLFRLGRLADAEQAFLRAIETHRTYGGLALLVGPYNGMGNVLTDQKRYGEARSYYERALALAAETGDRTSVGTTHMHLGRCAALQGHFADAKHEFTMALNALEETRFWNGLARAYEYIAEMHLQLGNFDEAIRCADKRIELARQHKNVRMESGAWIQKAEALNRAGRTEDAAACMERARLC
jgi:tetratricopeptide (TPR) repeat protein/tRNA A-37 threonylcarbamoyl transferase component Bud32